MSETTLPNSTATNETSKNETLVFVSARVPKELHRAALKRNADTGASFQDIIIEAVTRYVEAGKTEAA